MRNHSKVWMTAALAMAAHVAIAQTESPKVTRQPGHVTATDSAKLTATVTAIDPATRTVTLKGQNGKVAQVDVSDEVRNFDQLKVGDVVSVEYKHALALSLKKDGGTAGAGQRETVTRSQPGAKPGGTVGREVTITADVMAVNAGTKTVTLKGPAGNVVDLVVEDPEQLKAIKKGDQVQAVYSEALAISVSPAASKK